MAERGTRAEINLAELEKLCALHPTDSELASWFGVSTKTIERRKSELAFSQVLERGRAKGKLNLRRIQYKMAESNPAMAIFLGKNLLGQSDQITYNFDIQIAVAGGAPGIEPEGIDMKMLREGR
jgi:hypothetical protein